MSEGNPVGIGLKAIFEELRTLPLPPPFWETHPQSIIYGAGNMGKDVFRVLTERGIPVIGFLDQKAQPGDHWSGVPIWPPGSEKLSSQDCKRISVIIAIHNHNRGAEIPLIVDRLRACGYECIVTLIELYDHFGQELQDRFWLTPRSFYLSLESVITHGLSLWADDESRALYVAILQFRLSADYGVPPQPDWGHQYFPADLPAWKGPLRFVDCGAFDGDTLSNLMNSGLPIEAIAAFEPDQENFGKLARFARENSTALRNITLWPCGVYSSTRQLHFASGNAEASMITPSGDMMIQCVSLDEAIPHFAPTLIKMDIEGAEYEALLGARRIIAQYRPGLAICLYHRPEHLWQIPLLITRLSTECGGGYKLYLRSHAHNGFELVVYAIAT